MCLVDRYGHALYLRKREHEVPACECNLIGRPFGVLIIVKPQYLNHAIIMRYFSKRDVRIIDPIVMPWPVEGRGLIIVTILLQLKMSRYYVPDADELQVCPFDDTHQVKALRMPIHLVDCKRSHPLDTRVQCPYYALHWVEPEEYKYHMQNCPFKARVEEEILFG